MATNTEPLADRRPTRGWLVVADEADARNNNFGNENSANIATLANAHSIKVVDTCEHDSGALSPKHLIEIVDEFAIAVVEELLD